MKSLTAVCQQTAAAGGGGGAGSMPAINSSGRISRPTHPHRGDGENAEMKMYLSKLKDLVPFMPKNRKLSKLEIIQHVIDYICDLQSELETHPEISSFDAATALNLNGVTQHLAASAGEIGENNDHDEDEVSSLRDNISRLSEDIQQQQQQNQSSPVAVMRQPLAARQSPNTILPASHQLPHHQQTLYPASSTAVHFISSSSNGIITTNSQLQQQQPSNETTDQQKQNASSSNRQQC